MNCKYCQTDGHYCLNRYYACEVCRAFIFDRIGYNEWDWAHESGLIAAIWYKIRSEGICIYFRYDLGKTEITKWVSSSRQDEVVLSLPYLLPATKELMNNLPKRIKTWMTFL